ncbi:MAG: putative metallopeptidase [Pirellulaceae bacterium]|nr:putative metallopeptidase [Pirellulaceae bacterium]
MPPTSEIAASTLAPFDFSAAMRAICADMIGRLPELAHIDLARVAVCFCQARKRVSHGLFASLLPLRFAGGSETTIRRGRTYTVQRLLGPAGDEYLYVLSFYLPRFMDLDFREKLITIVHELWHISPNFDGDIRRHAGRCFAHTGSQKEYDAHMDVLAQRWLSCQPPEVLWSFLVGSFDDLARRHQRIVGLKVPRPKLLPVTG